MIPANHYLSLYQSSFNTKIDVLGPVYPQYEKHDLDIPSK
jgi:hypothetical protein